MLLGGAGDAALIGAAGLVGQQEATRRYLQGLEEFQPIARGLGEATGFAAPLAASLLTGGSTGAAALAARGATAVPRALSAAGAATEAAAARGLAGLGLAQGGAVARGLSMAAGQAVEMGVYGAGEALSRVAVQRPELTGEQAVAALGQGFLHGALAGGIGGAALGAAVPLVRGAVSKGLEATTGIAERVTGRTSAIGEGSIGQQISKLVDTSIGVGGIEKWAEEKAIKSLGARNQAMMEKALARSEGVRAEMATIIVDDMPKALGRDAGSILSHSEQKQALEVLKKTAGEQKGAIVKELEATGFKVDVPAVTKRLRDSIKPLAEGMLDESIAAHRKMSRTIDRLEKNFADGDIGKMWSQQKALGKEMERNGAWNRLRTGQNVTALDKANADLYAAIGDEFFRIGSEAQGVSQDFVKRWQDINRRYNAVASLEPMVQKGAAKDVNWRTLGFSEQVGALGGSTTGAMVGGAVAGPVGAAIGSAVGGVTSAAAHHLIRKYGDQAAASVLRSVAKSGGDVFQAAAVIAERTMGQAVTSYVKSAAKAAAPIAKRAALGAELGATKAMLTTGERKEQKLPKAAVRTAGVPLLQASPLARVEPRPGPRGAGQSSVEQKYRAAKAATEDFATASSQARVKAAIGLMAPGDIARATAQTAIRGSEYLMRKLPTDTATGKTLQPKFDDVTPSEETMTSWLRAAAVVDNPMTVFDSLRRGDLTTDEVDALRNVYPEMYAELQAAVMSEVATLDRPLPYDRALQLGLLIGVPAHPSMTPEYIAMQQKALTAEPAKTQPRPAQRPANLARGYALDIEGEAT